MIILKKNVKIIECNKRGVISHHGQKLDQPNLEGFFSLIFYVNKKTPVLALNEFLNCLDEIGIPASIIKNKCLKDRPKNVKSKPV